MNLVAITGTWSSAVVTGAGSGAVCHRKPFTCSRPGARDCRIAARVGIPYVFKASFDKRSHIRHVVSRAGMEYVLESLRGVKSRLGSHPDRHSRGVPGRCVAEVADVLQIRRFFRGKPTSLRLRAPPDGYQHQEGQFLAPLDGATPSRMSRPRQPEGVHHRARLFGWLQQLSVDMRAFDDARAWRAGSLT